MKQKVVNFTVEPVLWKEFDEKYIKAKGYSTEAETFRHLMRQAIEEQSNASFHETVDK